MNLIVEQGNTATKVAVCDRGVIVHTSMYKNHSLSGLYSWIEQYPVEKGIFSTVASADESLITYLTKKLKYLLFLDEQTRLPVTVRYRTPSTLGKDRIAAVTGAHFLRPGANVLVIDAGTAITYDVVEASGVYIGGNISPGMTTRFRALNRFTAQLPLVQEEEAVPFLGSSTESAIQAGVVNGIVYEMDGYINDLQEKYPDLFVFLTGGHSFYFERRLKTSIFAAINLVLIGLNRILEYNVEHN